MVKKIFAIFFIYFCTSVAWFILGISMNERSIKSNAKLSEAVNRLGWDSQIQKAPSVYYKIEEETKKYERLVQTEHGPEIIYDVAKTAKTYYVPLESSLINVDLKLDYRKKGLIWYSTYHVSFNAKYRIKNTTNELQEMHFIFPLPSQNAIYDKFHFKENGAEISDVKPESGCLSKMIHLEPGAVSDYEINYISRGVDEWRYNFGENVNQVKNFSLTINTDFDNFDFPENSLSPTLKKPKGKGWNLKWQYSNLLSGINIGILMPHKLNPGPWVAEVSCSAPISLFLFFFLLLIFTTVKQIKVHPMNYFFIAAAYFSFHLLLAYLVDHISIHLAFIISSIVSIFLVVSYMRLVVDKRFAFVEIGIAQFVYLVLFSYTFFFEGYTGLAITVLCIITLFIVMQFTGRIDWESIYRKPIST